jgi:iron complex transport system ATP-binding protein
MSPPLLALHDVEYRYNTNSQAVFEHFNIQVESDSITTFLGPNGSGKTTLLHLLLGWLKPQRGQVRLHGLPLGSYSRRELGCWMSLVPQSEHIAYDYSVLEYVLFGRTPYLGALEMPGEEDCQAAIEALSRVGIPMLAERSVSRLSGGERQLVLLARALAQQPKLLLMDEPTSHLDLANKSNLIALLRELNKQGVTILMTTHEPEVVSSIATHVALLKDGRLLLSGLVENVFTSDNLSQVYGIPIEVHNFKDRRVVLWP